MQAVNALCLENLAFGLARRCYVMVRSGTDIIKIAWLSILGRRVYAGVSPNPSDYLEPLY